MRSDAKWIVGTGVAVLAGLLLTQMSAVHVRLDDRLRAVEIGFGKVHQRLLTIERVVLPAPSVPGQ